jgi:hypothetical protein
LVCPFFELSFSLLRPGGQLGFIVSNAFAKREFGKPLVESLFPTLDLQKVIDCSGLMFPGHGTPTCIVLGRNQQPDPRVPIRVAAILPGGGDLRTPPEESPLWHTLAQRHDEPGYTDTRVVVADHSRAQAAVWPWDLLFGSGTERSALLPCTHPLLALCTEPIGAQFITGRDEAYVVPPDYARRLGVPLANLKAYGTGEDVRNWTAETTDLILFPYSQNLEPLREPLPAGLCRHLAPLKENLENVVISGSTKKKETRLKWFEFRRLARPKFARPLNVILPQIATHAHFLVADHTIAFKEKAQAIALRPELGETAHLLLAALLNSSAALFWLKQVCFSKRESAEGVTDTYFEFSGGKVEEAPVPEPIAAALRGEGDGLTERLTELARKCWEHGQLLPSLTMRKLFEKPGEAYHDWNASLAGRVAPHPDIAVPFQTADDVRAAFGRVVAIREAFRAEMIGFQEEMDWLVYGAYGLVGANPSRARQQASARSLTVAARNGAGSLAREQRPFCLWARAEGDFDKAVLLIPHEWPAQRRSLWAERLATIRDNEHLRRIEQPVYKRRWDEQWKVGGRWQCGQPAYDAEFLAALHWWLSEKAEWWLENQKGGGPVNLPEWTESLWSDSRVQAAWQVAAEVEQRLTAWKQSRVGGESLPRPETQPDSLQASLFGQESAIGIASYSAFARSFKALVREQAVPDSIPWAVPWDQIKVKVPAQTKKIRGKLNVPRERFRVTAEGAYLWAGKAGVG